MLELVYTAAPKGLISGRSGFVTIEMTEGFPPNLVSPVENLSGYKALYPPEAPNAADNPANFCYQLYGKGSATYCIASRISYAGLSYTGRSNNLAHHLLFTREELAAVPGGPAAVLACDGNFPPAAQAPRTLPPRRACTNAAAAADGSAWKRLCGDARWAKVLAEQFRQNRARCAILQFTPGRHSAKEILELVAEVTQHLTPQEAVDFTFSTYCYQSSIGNPIYLRAYPEGSPFLASIRRLTPRGVIVLGENNPLGEEELRLIAPPPVQEKPLTVPEASPTGAGDEHSSIPAQQETAALAQQNRPAPRSAPARRRPAPPHRHASAEEPRESNGHTTYVIMGVAITLVVMPLLYVILAQCGIIGGKKADGGTPKPAATIEAHPAEAPAPKPKSAEAPAPKPEPAEAPAPKPKPTPAATEPSEKKNAVPAAPEGLSLQERYDFYDAFCLKHEKSVTLPSCLPVNGRLAIDIDGIGQLSKGELGDELLRQCIVQKDDRHVIVYPTRVISGGGMLSGTRREADKSSSGGGMEIFLDGRELRIEESASRQEHQPGRQNIRSIAIGGMMLFQRDFSSEFVPLLAARSPVAQEYVLKTDGTFLCRLSAPKELQGSRDLLLNVEYTSPDGRQHVLDLPIDALSSQEFTITKLGGLDTRQNELTQFEEHRKALVKIEDDLEELYQGFFPDFSGFRNLEQLPLKVNAEDFSKKLEEAFTPLKQALRAIIDAAGKKELQSCLQDAGKYKTPMKQAKEHMKTLNKLREQLNRDDKKKDDQKVVSDDLARCQAFIEGIEKGWQEKQELFGKYDSKSFSEANDALARELQGILSREAFDRHFKACFDADNPSKISLKKLKDELARSYPLKVTLKAKQP